nr:MAG TPA: hypothetical protein [Caudoviricetes sp.]
MHILHCSYACSLLRSCSNLFSHNLPFAHCISKILFPLFSPLSYSYFHLLQIIHSFFIL